MSTIIFTDQIYTLSDIQIKNNQKKIDNFIIPDPNEELITIYEIDRLINIIGIRAEKYKSPEFKNELENIKNEKGYSEKTVNKTNQKKTKLLKSKSKLVIPKSNQFKIPLGVQNPNYTEILKILSKIRKGDKDNFKILVDKITNLNIIKTKDTYILKKFNVPVDVRLINSLDSYLDYLYSTY